jgi:23S rRNA A2030 N6-methylase RlmJ
MANPHFANVGDVWKHLLLTEVITSLRPEHYVETHAGSASYPLTGDAERALGARAFLTASPQTEPLRSSPYRRHLLELARGDEPSYPGSPLLAMMSLGQGCRYVFCDTDPASAASLQAARDRLGLRDNAEVIHGDGLAQVTALMRTHAISAASLVHVDPFDFQRADGPDALSALDVVTCLAAAGIPTFAWHGLTASSAPHELIGEVTTAAPATRAWSAELRVSGRRADSAGIGPGCAILFTAADLEPTGSMRRAADAYIRAFNEQSNASGREVHLTASFATTASETS